MLTQSLLNVKFSRGPCAGPSHELAGLALGTTYMVHLPAFFGKRWSTRDQGNFNNLDCIMYFPFEVNLIDSSTNFKRRIIYNTCLLIVINVCHDKLLFVDTI